MNVLVTGATGLIGKEIVPLLVKKGHNVFVVSRSKESAEKSFKVSVEVIVGDFSKAVIKDERLKKIDAVLNLMGEPISERWSAAKKQRIFNSRVTGTQNLVKSLPSVQVFVSGSAIGYYGDQGDKKLSETAENGNDFLADVCRQWEEAAMKAKAYRIAIIRTGLVLSKDGGALKSMLLPFKTGLGGPLASGDQYMSWVHHTDISKLFIYALENSDVQGVYNGTADKPETNLNFSKKLAKTLNKGMGPSVPKFALKLLYGEATEAILSSQKCSNSKIQKTGFSFAYSNLEDALEQILN